MIVNLTCFNSSSLFDIVSKSIIFFGDNKATKFTDSLIWSDEMYVKFSKNIITIRILDEKNFQKINRYLSYTLENESVYVSSCKNQGRYFENIKKDTNFCFLF